MRDSSKTKATLKRAALEMFVEKGINGATVQDIGKKAKVAVGTLYRHYPSKEALARELYLEYAAGITHEFEKLKSESHDFESFLSSLIIYLCQVFDKDPVLFSYIMLPQPSTFAHLDVLDKMPQQVLQTVVYQTFQKRGQLERNADLVTAQIMGSILQAATCHLYGTFPKSLSDYADELVFAAFRIVRD